MRAHRELKCSLAGLAALAMGGTALADGLALTGEITYRERMALPDTAVAVIELVETAPSGAVIAAETVAPAGQVPIAFALVLDPGEIDPGTDYGLQARIEVDGAPWFASAAPLAVAPLDHTGPLVLALVRAGAPEAPGPVETGDGPEPSEPEDGLVATQWRLVEIDGAPAAPDVGTTLVFNADGGLGGEGGCNVYGGSVAFSGTDGIEITDVFSTLMACEEPKMGQEQAFFAALGAAATYAYAPDSLVLYDAEGTARAVLEGF